MRSHSLNLAYPSIQVSVIRKMLDLGFEANVPTNSGRYPIHCLLDQIVTSDWISNPSESVSGWEDAALDLLKNFDVSQLSIENETPFASSVVSTGSLVLVKWLIDNDVDHSLVSHDGVTLFELIVNHPNEKVAGEMMDYALSKTTLEGVLHVIGRALDQGCGSFLFRHSHSFQLIPLFFL